MMQDRPSPRTDIESREADVLDSQTVDEIERLRSAVVHAEAEHRFGVGRGKRSELLVAAEEAEHAFLNSHDFGSYNDYRLRIRRSTVISASDVGDASPTPDVPKPDADSFRSASTGPDTAVDQPRADSAADADPVVDTHPRPQPDPPSTDSASPDLHSLAITFAAAVTSASDGIVAALIAAAEAQAADILAQASTQAGDITDRAEKIRAIARSVADSNAQRLATLQGLTTDIERLGRTNTADPDGPLTMALSNPGSTD